MNQPLAVRTEKLCKAFGDVRALVDVDFAIPAGSVCALIGRNGAGKTTAIHSLLGMVHPTSGSGEVLGCPIGAAGDSVEIRRRVAFVDPTALYSWMTVGEILNLARRCYPDWNRSREVAGIFALDLPLKRRVSALSKGMRTKLGLLIALARDAELLMFDEPTDGLDPVVREQIMQALVAVNASRGVTLVISSHQLVELEDIANWICLLDRGRLRLAGEMDEVRAMHHRIDFAVREAHDLAIAAVSGAVSLTRAGAFGSLIVCGNIDDALRTLGPMAVRHQGASLKEIVLAYAAPDVGNANWVLTGGVRHVA